jgi:hypothetical protein
VLIKHKKLKDVLQLVFEPSLPYGPGVFVFLSLYFDPYFRQKDQTSTTGCLAGKVELLLILKMYCGTVYLRWLPGSALGSPALIINTLNDRARS